MRELPAPPLPGWLGEMVPFRRYRVEVGAGLEMHVMERGSGRPVLAFHGNPTWGFLYRKIAMELDGEPFRVIAPDLIGLGFSDRPGGAGDHTLENHVGWMARLIDVLGLDAPIVVVQDWGGPIGLGAMGRHPGLMSGVVVCNTAVTMPKPGFRPTTFHRVFSTPAGRLASKYLGLPQRGLRYAQGDRGSITRRVSRAYRYPLSLRRGNEAVSALVRMVPSSMEHPTVRGLEQIGESMGDFTGRSAIVWGDNDPVLGRLRRRHERMFPDARVTATPAGHFLQEEVPGAVADAIRHVAGGDSSNAGL